MKTTEVAVIPTWSAVVEPGEDNIARLRILHKGIRLACYEFAVRCRAELDGPGSKTQQDVADEIGCSLDTVSRATRSLKTAMAVSASGDLDPADAYDDAMREVRAPKRRDGGDTSDLGDVLATDIRSWLSKATELLSRMRAIEPVNEPLVTQRLAQHVEMVQEIQQRGWGAEPEPDIVDAELVDEPGESAAWQSGAKIGPGCQENPWKELELAQEVVAKQSWPLSKSRWDRIQRLFRKLEKLAPVDLEVKHRSDATMR